MTRFLYDRLATPLRTCLLMMVALASVLSVGCGGADDPRIQVVCTTGMVADLAREVGGEHVAVTQLMQEGIDPHRYQPNPGDVRQLSDSDIILYSGRNLEGKMGTIFANMAKKKLTVAVTEKIPDSEILEDDNNHNDPHLWFDVKLWSNTVDVVRDALIKRDPAHADDYKANATAYKAKLEKLHEEVEADIASIPKDRRVLVTAHDAFQYFGKAYDIEVMSIQGISTESEASGAKIDRLVKTLADRKIKAVFVESSVPKKYMQALIEGCQMRFGHTVREGGELFSDAMGKSGTPEGTYVGMVRHNVRTIVQALK